MVLLRGPNPPDYDLELETLNGNPIPNTRGSNLQPFLLQESAKHWQRQFPEMRIIIADGMYNCVGLVFAARRTTIISRHIHWILKEDGYYQLPDNTLFDIGDIVLYGTGPYDDQLEHIGIIWQIESDAKNARQKEWVLSKWGAPGPECLHLIDRVPSQYGHVVEHWRHKNYYEA